MAHPLILALLNQRMSLSLGALKTCSTFCGGLPRLSNALALKFWWPISGDSGLVIQLWWLSSSGDQATQDKILSLNG